MIEKYMNLAIKEANKAFCKNEIPVGCVIVSNNKIISKSYNKVERTNICFYHAEIRAILKASKKKKSWRLDDCELYVTLEPCNMCKEVIKKSRIKKVYFLLNSNYEKNQNKNVNVEKVFMPNVEKKYQETLQSFFFNKR